MNYFQGLLFAPLALLAPNSALPVFLLWLGIYGWCKSSTRYPTESTPINLAESCASKGDSFIVRICSRYMLFSYAFPRDILKILVLFLSWACLSSFWSLSPHASAIATIKLLIVVFLGLSWLSFCFQQTSTATFLFLKGLAIGCAGIAVFMLADRAFGETFVQLRGTTSIKAYSAASHTLALCFYPLCFWLYKQGTPWLSFLFASLVIAALCTIDIDIILVALAFGGLTQSLAFLLSRKSFKGLWQSGLILVMATLPFFFAYLLSSTTIETINGYLPNFSYIHRLHIWNFLSEKIVQAPWIGYGLDTSQLQIIRPPFYTWTFFEKITNYPLVVQNSLPHNPLFSHPHNVIIQWWFELGAMGILLSGLFLLKVFARVHNWPHPQRILTFGYSATAIAIALVSVDFWHTWWFSALWVSCGIVVLVNRTLNEAGS